MRSIRRSSECSAAPTRRSAPGGGHFQASSTHDAWDDLARISAPTLVVHGADDEITPVANGRDLAERIRGASFLEVAGGHGIHLESPTVRDAIVAFAHAHPLPGP